MKTTATEMFGIDLPLFAFSHCRDVVAAVSRAGGLGVLGALEFSPEQLEIELRWIDEHAGGRPYGVDVVMPASYAGAGELDPNQMDGQLAAMIPDGHREWVEQVLREYGVPPLASDDEKPTGLLSWTHEGVRPQVDVALSHPIALLVNALGPPPRDVVELAHAQGVKVGALVGAVHHAQRQVNQGVDLIIAQGTEAAGHTGDVATMVLVPDVVDAVDPVPVLAAGGIGSGRQMAAGMALGAAGVWTGSIWLTVEEAASSPAQIEKLLAATSSSTVRSRSGSGKPARMLRTPWTDAWERPDCPGTLPVPLQAMLAADAVERINKYQVKDLVGATVGQVVGRMDSVRPVKRVVYDMIEDFIEAVDNLHRLVESG